MPSTFNVGTSTDLGYDKITENDAALRQIMRLRGFSLMTNILQDYAKDVEVTILVRFHFLRTPFDSLKVDLSKALEAMVKWPLIQRNKVDDSKIRVPVQVCAESENEGMRSLSLKVCSCRPWGSHVGSHQTPSFLNIGIPLR